ncbi:MAG: DUF1800 family protein [Deltaproteobacteria bacterium]|nr:DUF1800 family protein [Deltaproteobacteria bacterium]
MAAFSAHRPRKVRPFGHPPHPAGAFPPTLCLILCLFLSLFFFPLNSPAVTPPSIDLASLDVVLIDGLTGQRLQGIKVTAAERLTTGKLKWVASRTTDDQGQAVFALAGLGRGRVYVLYARVFNQITSYSDDLVQSGKYIFRVGKLEVTAVSGADGTRLSDYKVSVKERLADGKLKWVASGKTDSRGVIRFDLEPFRDYVLYANSPVDGSGKFSGSVAAEGRFTFVVGNRPLTVTLVNGLSQAPLAGIKVTAAERLATGKLKWAASRTTDDQGRAVFDLNGLGQGRSYVFSCRPYNGGTVYSPDLNQPGEFTFRVGTLPVTLVDAVSGMPLVDRKLVVYEKSSDGKLHWRKSGTTDTGGRVIFDLPGLGQGRVYVIKAYDPFNEGQKYYSPWVTVEGEMIFAVTPGVAPYRPDLKPPWINIDSPRNRSLVSDVGFILEGRATDDRAVERVEIIVGNPGPGSRPLPAQYNPVTGHWRCEVPAAAISAGQTVELTARVVDSAYNEMLATVELDVIVDNQAPELKITSQADNDTVFDSGFMVSGYAVDNTGVTSLRAVLVDPLSGSQVVAENLPVAVTGRWTLNVAKERLTAGQTVELRLVAADRPGNEGHARVRLQVAAADLNPVQLLNRITFGATPALLEEVRRIGPEAFFERQLHPETVDNSAFEQALGGWKPEKRYEMTSYQVVYAAYSFRQLQEMMTWFWENHFNTDISKHGRIEYELRENRLFRENALGRFRDLLTISATSPAMLYYLDNVSNRRQAPNENYAREIMELHTMGVDGGYTQADIVEVARAFTGWRVHDGEFEFSEYRHDFGEKVVLGEVLPAGQGVEDGYQVIDILARHPATARFISKKLLQFFLTDEPLPELIGKVAEVFLGSGGDIAAVVSLIIHLPEFSRAEYFHNKVKTPLELVAGLLRNLPVAPVARHLRYAMDGMGMRSFYYPLPTGWPETGDKWVNSDQLLQRLLFINAVAFNERRDSTRVCYVDLNGFFRNRGYETAPGIVGYLFELLLGNDYTRLEWELATAILTDNQTITFDINQPDAEARLRELTATILSFPAYQLQ